MLPPEQSSIFALLGVDTRDRWPEVFDTERGDFVYVFDQPEWLTEDTLDTLLFEANLVRDQMNISLYEMPIHFVIADRLDSLDEIESEETQNPVRFYYIEELNSFMVIIYPNELEDVYAREADDPNNDAPLAPIEFYLATLTWKEVSHACQVWQIAPTDRIAYMEGIDSL